MRLFRIFKGEAFEICSFEQERESSVRKLLDELEENDPSEYRALMTRIRHIAQSGQPANNRQMRPLKGKNAEKLFEIKTTSGSRVICFYEKGKLIICTHGFHKIKDIQLKRYIKSAQKERGEYLKWTQSKA